MTKDDEIRHGLKTAGVPDSVFSTTLVKEGQDKLRQYIIDRVLSRKGIWLYAKPRLAASARKTFYLLAKELFLSGTTVCCIPLSRLADALNSDEFFGEAVMVERVKAVFILDFYESGAGFPLDAYNASRVRTWIRSKIESGGVVSLLSDTTPDKCTDWWPTSFMGYLTDATISHELTA